MAALTKSILFASCLLLSNWCYSHARFGQGSLHASCRINWTFGIPCANVKKQIIDQIDEWKGDDCGTGEKCRYQFTSFEGNILKAKHETPQNHYIDDLTFTLSEENSLCKVEGYSTSEVWYAILDYGTNYCNLHNLITGSGLNKVQNYTEETNNSKCTQYSSANCEKY